ncbi:MAG: hypothetical protein KAV44_06950 [Bacteroidales bacterium]|nr:hypothetical protein [Bacteroidales bacterium]
MKILKKILGITILCIIFGLITITAFSQGPGPPPPPDHGSIGNQNKGGAPIGGGLFILLGLGAAYGGFKGYKFYKKKNKSMLD